MKLRRSALRVTAVLGAVIIGLGIVACSSPDTDPDPSPAAGALQTAVDGLVGASDGPPGVLALVDRGAGAETYTAGTGDTDTGVPIAVDDVTRIASVSKAFAGAAALDLIDDGRLELDSTIGASVTGMPEAWWSVTVAQLLQHTAGIPDYIRTPEFLEALTSDPGRSWEPRQLIEFVADQPLEFAPGSEYRYSDTDNIVIGLIVEQAGGEPYATALRNRIYEPLGLAATSLPSTTDLPTPHVNGYDRSESGDTENVSELISPTGAWASGGMLSTAADLNTFVRAYVSGELIGPAQHEAQFTFVPGAGGPPGPGENEAGLAVYRYTTECGVVYGHTGNFPGYTTFIAASEDGTRSAVVLVNTQINDAEPDLFQHLTTVFEAAACALLD
ncbi:serine hydrolase domain-containing protein [Gordonia caeni]|uniref:serine hydrolase domain-containing protein n=1 Tax=Gordonia caeni TaxID=1007097 RepID=UPI0031E3BB96